MILTSLSRYEMNQSTSKICEKLLHTKKKLRDLISPLIDADPLPVVYCVRTDTSIVLRLSCTSTKHPELTWNPSKRTFGPELEQQE